MQRDDSQGNPGAPQASSAFEGVEGYQKKGESSLLSYWNIMLRAFFSNKWYIPTKSVGRKEMREKTERDDSMKICWVV